tara:strand:+ start:71 stop:220 length:150 start_codon:yes stop_codon:yes gene_type:complete
MRTNPGNSLLPMGKKSEKLSTNQYLKGAKTKKKKKVKEKSSPRTFLAQK